MHWARDRRLGFLLSFWLLWSTVGIKLYLEYCACHEAIQASLFAPEDKSCGTDKWADYVAMGDEHAGEAHGCCLPPDSEAPASASCCKAGHDIPVCPPEGCDSHEVREFKVSTPFLLSSHDWPDVHPCAFLPITSFEVPEREAAVADHFPVERHECSYSSRFYRILYESFLC